MDLNIKLKFKIGIEVFWCENLNSQSVTVQSGRLAKYEITPTTVYCMIELPKMPGFLPRPQQIVSDNPGDAEKVYYQAVVQCKEKEIDKLKTQIKNLNETIDTLEKA